MNLKIGTSPQDAAMGVSWMLGMHYNGRRVTNYVMREIVYCQHKEVQKYARRHGSDLGQEVECYNYAMSVCMLGVVWLRGQLVLTVVRLSR